MKIWKYVGLALTCTSVIAVQSLVSSTKVNAKSPGEMRIGLVDMQKTLQTIEAGKKARAKLEKDFNARRKELQTEEAAIKKMTEDFQLKAPAMNDAARAKENQKISERIYTFQQKTAKSQAEIQQEQNELTLPLISKAKVSIGKKAKEKGMRLVLDKNENTVLYSHEEDDMTNEVIADINKQNAGG